MQIRLDCLGDICPIPIIKMRKELKKLDRDDSLLIVTDHSCVARSLTEELGKKKYSFTENEVMSGIWEITITKS